MKQIMQNYKTGELDIKDVPAPLLTGHSVLVKNMASLISAGTEKTKVDTARMNLVNKARNRPDLVRQVVTNVQQEGLVPTVKKVLNKLDTPVSLGYSSCGEVIAVGSEVKVLKVGDCVVCAGEISAAHAQLVTTPQNLCAVVPWGVKPQEATYAPVGAIGLQAVRLAGIELGQRIAVIGLGLIGQLIVQLAQSSGADVFGIEIDPSKLELAKKMGMRAGVNQLTDPVAAMANDFTDGLGMDAVIVAAASDQEKTLDLAGSICREKGRVVLLGAGDIHAPRLHYYQKEINLVVSRAFGPGSYDSNYIADSQDYPPGYVRWTAQRNMQTFLHLLGQKKINLEGITTHTFPLERAAEAYDMINTNSSPYVGIILTYDDTVSLARKVVRAQGLMESAANIKVGFVGAGSFAQNYLIPPLKKHPKVQLVGVATAKGMTARNTADKFAFQYCSTDASEIIQDARINTVVIATRHNLHARFLIEALKAGKHVFVEKPLAVNAEQLEEVIQALEQYPGMLMVGFNRRFSPFVEKIEAFFSNRSGPLVMDYRVNAGYLPAEHWANTEEGGGRIVGEVCHFIDLFQFLAKSPPVRVYADVARGSDSNKPLELTDNLSVIVTFQDGSMANLVYTSLGDMSYSRERLEVYCGQSIAVLDNYKKLSLVRMGKSENFTLFSRDMGIDREVATFVDALLSDHPKSPIPPQELYLTTLCTFKILEAIRTGKAQEIAWKATRT
ncbi:MAG: putative zinc-binding dehydrogenase [Magnetococcales bacterium]|nr:putative zinc-binding dehydrogenase [Magnetococcales bacterium]HIJ83485.1 Gfo/Idh/MocA family oxidoreductase [Magnetococcales bacterium]